MSTHRKTTPPAPAREAWRDFSYDAWVTEQATRIKAQIRRHGRALTDYGPNAALWVLPSAGPLPGQLILADTAPSETYGPFRHMKAPMPIRFPAQGTNVMRVPYPHLRSLLWEACRSAPICPTA
jgi:hypothetical protein